VAYKDGEILHLFKDLFHQPSFKAIKILLSDIETEGVHLVGNDRGDALEGVELIRMVADFRRRLDQFAAEVGITEGLF